MIGACFLRFSNLLNLRQTTSAYRHRLSTTTASCKSTNQANFRANMRFYVSKGSVTRSLLTPSVRIHVDDLASEHNSHDLSWFIVVDSRLRRKKSRSALNVFQFAETVEPGAWDDEQKKKDLEVCAEVSVLTYSSDALMSSGTSICTLTRVFAQGESSCPPRVCFSNCWCP